MLPTSDKSAVSLKQIYRIASIARGKLGAAADQPEHNLRLMVGHANFLDGLTETILNSPSEDDRETSADKWADALNGLDQESEESDCSEDSDENLSFEGNTSSYDIPIEQLSGKKKTEKPSAGSVRPEPKMPAVLFAAFSDMPELKRMKHLPILESIVEEDWDDEANVIVQAMEVVPAALQTLQTLQTLQMAEMDAIVRITEIEVSAETETSFDTGSIRLSAASTMASA